MMTPDEVLDFWFAGDPATHRKAWFERSTEFDATCGRFADALRDAVVTATALSETLGDAITGVITTAVGALRDHPALVFISTHEPEVLLPFLAFEREDAVLRTAAVLVAPAYARFLNDVDATRLGEWIAVCVTRCVGRPSALIATSRGTKRWPLRS